LISQEIHAPAQNTATGTATNIPAAPPRTKGLKRSEEAVQSSFGNAQAVRPRRVNAKQWAIGLVIDRFLTARSMRHAHEPDRKSKND